MNSLLVELWKEESFRLLFWSSCPAATKASLPHFPKRFSNLLFFVSPSQPGDHVCTNSMCDALDPSEMNWWMPHLCGRERQTFRFLSSSDETHILWHEFRLWNKIFYTMIKHIFVLYKHFLRASTFRRTWRGNLCQTMINFYNIRVGGKGSCDGSNKWNIKVSPMIQNNLLRASPTACAHVKFKYRIHISFVFNLNSSFDVLEMIQIGSFIFLRCIFSDGADGALRRKLVFRE